MISQNNNNNNNNDKQAIIWPNGELVTKLTDAYKYHQLSMS